MPNERDQVMGAPDGRRAALRRLAIGAGAAWTAPLVLAAPAGAAAVSPAPPACVDKLFNVKIQPDDEDVDDADLLFEGSGYNVVTNPESGNGTGQCVGRLEDLPANPKPRASRAELEAFAAALVVDVADPFEDAVTVELPADCDLSSLIAYKKIGNSNPEPCVRAGAADVDELDRTVSFRKESGRGQGISHVEIVVCCCVEESVAP